MPSRSNAPTASIVVPTRERFEYLQVALASIAPQAVAGGAELLVVDDAGPSRRVRELVERYGGRYLPHPRPLGLNLARNTGVEHSRGELVVFVDDDVQVFEGWLSALLGAATAHPEVEVFTGPIRPLLERPPLRGCGREAPPITTLELGPRDMRTRFAWGANMAIRRRAFARIGPFDSALEHGGDEQDWQERLGGEALYVAAAALLHRRTARDARLLALCRGAYARGRAARRFDVWRGHTPSAARELLTLGGCIGHVVRRRCLAAVVTVAHSAGRARELRGSHPVRPASVLQEDFLSGESGAIGGVGAARRRLLDAATETLARLSPRRARLERLARGSPPRRRVLALCVERPHNAALVAALRAELERSHHQVSFHATPAAANDAAQTPGKFENLNLLLRAHPPEGFDWLIAIDDDVMLPSGFLDRFLFLAERFGLDLAQPAHRLASHAAWRVTRRHPASLVRETRFVEIGPVTAFARATFSSLLPFPQLRMGWGLDLHWGAIAEERGWRCGVIDATAITHRQAPAASAYSREQAIAEARSFLATRSYVRARDAQRTLVTHRRL